MKADGQRVPWRRDPVNVFAFHIDAPAGARALELEYQYVSPTQTAQGRVVSTPDLLNLQWNNMLLYPAGFAAKRIRYQATLTLPAGWRQGGALDVESETANVTRFKETDLETLVDSPLFAGKHFQRIDLTQGEKLPVHLNIVADRADLLPAKDEHIAAHKRLIRETDALFGTRPWDRYEFLLALSENMGGIGLEHHRSSENNPGATYFSEWDKTAPDRDLLPHEIVHSWNGKMRRPADLWTASFDVPMRNSLLWVYEGQTQYWGTVLAGRSGLWTGEQMLENLALIAATYEARAGRVWRALEDTTNEPIISSRRPQPWRSWQRPEDYYSEGLLIWLDADTLIRERSNNRRSLDDFARRFFGLKSGDWTPVTYTFDDVVAALNAVEPYDWAGFLNARVRDVAEKAPLDGITRGGYRLVFKEEPSAFQKLTDAGNKVQDFTYSLGFTVGEGDKLTAVQWDRPAFNAGLAIGAQLIAVNGLTYSAEALKRAVKEAATEGGPPISLVAKSGDRVRMLEIPYRGGLRYPHLERVSGTPDRLSAIVRGRAR